MSLNALFKEKEKAPEVGASISELQSQITGDVAKVMAAGQAVQAGTATEEQKEIIRNLYRNAMQSAVPPKLSEDKRTVTMVVPPGIPIVVPLKDVAEGVVAAEKIYSKVGPTKGVRTGISVLGWIAENPKLAAGLAVAGIGAWFFGPTLAPYIASAVLGRRRK